MQFYLPLENETNAALKCLSGEAFFKSSSKLTTDVHLSVVLLTACAEDLKARISQQIWLAPLIPLCKYSLKHTLILGHFSLSQNRSRNPIM